MKFPSLRGRALAFLGAALMLGSVTAYASGMFPGLGAASTEIGPSGLTGLERIPADTQALAGVQPESVYITPDDLYGGHLITDSTNGAITGTAAQYSGWPLIYVRLTGAISGATNAQLPTAAAMYAVWQAYPQYNSTSTASSKCWFVKVINAAGTGSGVWTMTTNTGLTLSGNMTVAVGGSRLLKLCMTSATAATVTDYGN